MNFVGTDHVSTIDVVQHATCSVGIQCDLLAVAPLQKLPKGSATATIEYGIGDEEVDLDTGDANVEADHNTRDADLDTSYQLITRRHHNRVQYKCSFIPNLFISTLYSDDTVEHPSATIESPSVLR